MLICQLVEGIFFLGCKIVKHAWNTDTNNLAESEKTDEAKENQIVREMFSGREMGSNAHLDCLTFDRS